MTKPSALLPEETSTLLQHAFLLSTQDVSIASPPSGDERNDQHISSPSDEIDPSRDFTPTLTVLLDKALEIIATFAEEEENEPKEQE
jgi:hypothetical protein